MFWKGHSTVCLHIHWATPQGACCTIKDTQTSVVSEDTLDSTHSSAKVQTLEMAHLMRRDTWKCAKYSVNRKPCKLCPWIYEWAWLFDLLRITIRGKAHAGMTVLPYVYVEIHEYEGEAAVTCQWWALCAAPLCRSSELWDHVSVVPGQPGLQVWPTQTSLAPRLHLSRGPQALEHLKYK